MLLRDCALSLVQDDRNNRDIKCHMEIFKINGLLIDASVIIIATTIWPSRTGYCFVLAWHYRLAAAKKSRMRWHPAFDGAYFIIAAAT